MPALGRSPQRVRKANYMTNRFRHISDRQVIGLYLLMQALLNGKKSVHLSNACLCKLLGVGTVFDKRIQELSASFAPYLGKYEIHARPGHAKTAIFLLPGAVNSKDSMNVSTLPTREEMEKALGLKIKVIKIEAKT